MLDQLEVFVGVLLYVHIRPKDTSVECPEKAGQRKNTSPVDQSNEGKYWVKGMQASTPISPSQKRTRHSGSTKKKATCVRQPKVFA